MAVSVDLEVFHMLAGRAHTPHFQRRQADVDLVDLHPALVGVEHVLRCKLRQRRLRRALVAFRRQRNVSTRVVWIIVALSSP